MRRRAARTWRRGSMPGLAAISRPTMRACTRRSVRIRTEGYGVGAARGHAHRRHGRACPGHSRHHAAKTCLTGSADGTLHAEGDKDLKLKGYSTVLKRGIMIKGIYPIAD